MIDNLPLLDSCVVSRIIDPRCESAELIETAKELIGQYGIWVPSIVEYELRRGFAKWEARGTHQRIRAAGDLLLQNAQIVSLDAPSGPIATAIEIYARAQAAKPARKIGELDLLIYATARAHGMTLVTADRKLKAHIDVLFEGRQLLFLEPSSAERKTYL